MGSRYSRELHRSLASVSTELTHMREEARGGGGTGGSTGLLTFPSVRNAISRSPQREDAGLIETLAHFAGEG